MVNNLKSIEKAIEDKKAELTKLQNIYDRSTVLKDRLLSARKNYGTFLSSRNKITETLTDLGITNPETIPVNGFSSANLEKAIKTKADENRYSFLVEKLRALDIEYRLAQYNIA